MPSRCRQSLIRANVITPRGGAHPRANAIHTGYAHTRRSLTASQLSCRHRGACSRVDAHHAVLQLVGVAASSQRRRRLCAQHGGICDWTRSSTICGDSGPQPQPSLLSLSRAGVGRGQSRCFIKSVFVKPTVNGARANSSYVAASTRATRLIDALLVKARARQGAGAVQH